MDASLQADQARVQAQTASDRSELKTLVQTHAFQRAANAMSDGAP
jgi:hypothetical protein